MNDLFFVYIFLQINTEDSVEEEQLGSGSGDEGSETTTPSEPDTTFELDTPAKSNLLDTDKSANFTFLSESTQLIKFVEQYTICSVTGCTGKLMFNYFEVTGLGGAASFNFRCATCGNRDIKFDSSSFRDHGDATVSVLFQCAFICAGMSYSQYMKVFRHILGMQCVSSSVFYATLQEIYPYVKNVLDTICLEARQQMKEMDQSTVGSWSRAVTCADAVWLTRGGFSRNCTYTVRNCMTGALLYYHHICQKGKDNLPEDEELYPGTSKSAEGYGADYLFNLIQTDGMNVECHIQDGDSTAGSAVSKYFPQCNIAIMLLKTMQKN